MAVVTRGLITLIYFQIPATGIRVNVVIVQSAKANPLSHFTIFTLKSNKNDIQMPERVIDQLFSAIIQPNS